MGKQQIDIFQQHYKLVCRNLKPLFNFEPPATKDEIEIASLQFIRKISGFNKPSKINKEIFDKSVDRISSVVVDLLNGLTTRSKPKNREAEAEKARVKFQKRLESLKSL